ncbi:MAG: hypothetical protein ACOX7D_02795 [Alphaproteobacteria bacterium]|jgi:GH24 family phage-related lysozyme (muramidase)
MTINEILNHLENSGFKVLNSDSTFIWLEDPTCFARSLSGFVDVAWVVITFFAGILLFGWGVSKIRGIQGDIIKNIRNLFLIFAILSASKLIAESLFGEKIFLCKTIQVPIAEVNKIIDSAELKLKTRDANNLYENIDIYDSATGTGMPSSIMGDIETTAPETPFEGTGIVSGGAGAGALSNNTALEAHILAHEGYRNQVYLDTKYLPTIGIGSLVNDYSRFALFDFYANGVKLTDSQKREYYDKVMAYASAAAARKDPMVQNLNTNTITNGTLSDGTRLADIRTTKESIQNEMKRYISSSESILSKSYKGWHSYPQPAKNALLDIAYGYGVAGIHNIRGLDNCVNNQDWICAADVATRTYASRKPGIQIRQWFLQAAGNQ